MFKTLITQLDHHMHVIATQVTIYQTTLNQWPDSEKDMIKDMSKVRNYFHSKINLSIDEENL